MAASMEPYETWLTERLLQLNPDTDTDVFVSYIMGILEEDAPKEEKLESMIDFIGQVVEDDIETVCDELYRKWEEFSGISQEQKQQENDGDKLTDHLASILEKQKIETVKVKEKSAEEIARKQAILSHYNDVASGEEDNDEDSGGQSSGQGDNLHDFKNTNSEVVKQVEQEKREQSRLESEKKKERDKQEREAQKQKQKDRKDTEKKRTQKGERRR